MAEVLTNRAAITWLNRLSLLEGPCSNDTFAIDQMPEDEEIGKSPFWRWTDSAEIFMRVVFLRSAHFVYSRVDAIADGDVNELDIGSCTSSWTCITREAFLWVKCSDLQPDDNVIWARASSCNLWGARYTIEAKVTLSLSTFLMVSGKRHTKLYCRHCTESSQRVVWWSSSQDDSMHTTADVIGSYPINLA